MRVSYKIFSWHVYLIIGYITDKFREILHDKLSFLRYNNLYSTFISTHLHIECTQLYIFKTVFNMDIIAIEDITDYKHASKWLYHYLFLRFPSSEIPSVYYKVFHKSMKFILYENDIRILNNHMR